MLRVKAQKPTPRVLTGPSFFFFSIHPLLHLRKYIGGLPRQLQRGVSSSNHAVVSSVFISVTSKVRKVYPAHFTHFCFAL